MPQIAIDIDRLAKVYQRKNREPIWAVNDVNLKVPQGQVFGLLGPNGAGKTTTIKMTCGLIKPSMGRIKLFGYNVEAERSDAMRQIGAVLEGARNISWRWTIWQNLMYLATLKGKTANEVTPRANQLLQELDLFGRKDQMAGQLSRGMQQKVAISCALIADPPIVLLDEPTLGLDVASARLIESWVREQVEKGKTIILTTHQLDMAQRVCDNVAIMKKGVLSQPTPPQDLINAELQNNYTIRLRGKLDATPAQLLNVPHVEFVETTYGQKEDITTIRCQATSANDMNNLLRALGSLGLTVVEISQDTPTLEDIFVRIVSNN